MLLRRVLLLLGLCAVFVACSDSSAAPVEPAPETLPVGELPPSSPAPIVTIDSPSAMMMISPKRSAKCAAETRKPPTSRMEGGA